MNNVTTFKTKSLRYIYTYAAFKRLDLQAVRSTWVVRRTFGPQSISNR